MDLKKALKLDKVDRFPSEYNGEAFWFEAKSEFVTPRFLQQLADADHNNQPIEFARALSTVLTAWDIEADGVAVPCTFEVIANTPRKFLRHMFDVISETYVGNAQTPSK